MKELTLLYKRKTKQIKFSSFREAARNQLEVALAVAPAAAHSRSDLAQEAAPEVVLAVAPEVALEAVHSRSDLA